MVTVAELCSIMDSVIRTAELDDAEAMLEVDRDAGESFRDVGMSYVADAELLALEQLTSCIDAGRAWVCDERGSLVGFVVAIVVDGCAHIDQVSVVRERRGERLGAALIERVESWAVSEGRPALTLTTFRDVPWNQPYYERLGFREVTPKPGTQLLDLVRREAIRFDPETRVAMERRTSINPWPLGLSQDGQRAR